MGAELEFDALDHSATTDHETCLTGFFYIIDVKFASGYRIFIFFFFYPYIDVCYHSTILGTFPESCEKHHRHVTRVGFEPTTLAILEQFHTNLTAEIVLVY